MPSVLVNGLSLEYESFGRDTDPCVLLVMGLGTQLTAWPVSLCEALVDRGYRVIRFDNRDVGLSTRLAHAGAPRVPLIATLRLLGLPVRVPYQLEDMALDAIGLMDALDIDRAHVVGASMGGMIAQLMAGHHAHRVLSLTSIMSTTGHRSLPGPDAKARRALLMKPDDPQDMSSVQRRNMTVRRTLESPSYRQSDASLEKMVSDALARGGYDPAAAARHLAAVLASGHRRALLAGVTVPSLVLHGEADILVKPACGRDTADCLPNSRFVTFPGMGHDLPEALMPEWAQLIDETATRAA